MKPYIIGIAGASCSGKTELATRLAQSLGAVICTLDSYYRDLGHLAPEERVRQNFDVPGALDHELLCEQVSALSRGERIQKPVYDFTRHIRSGQTEILEPGQTVIVDGLFTLHWEQLRSLLGLKVFIEISDDICLQRRIDRDARERGRTPQSVREQFATTVRPMTDLHIRPTRTFADLVLNGEDSPEQGYRAVLSAIAATGRLRAALT
ncbi:MAG: uridine kinase [Bryobacterales bacterium]|nr:uridine kinase [Bryobacterales bacterium]